MSTQRLETAFLLVGCYCWTWIPLRRRTVHDRCSVASATESESESLEECMEDSLREVVQYPGYSGLSN